MLRSRRSWGTATATSPFCAIGLALLGFALLILAWRDSLKADGGPPADSAPARESLA